MKLPPVLLTGFCGFMFLLFTQAFSRSSDDVPQNQDSDKSKVALSSADPHLRQLNGLIGEWRGVGQPKRGSRQGAWTETTTFVWDFARPGGSVIAKSNDGQQFTSLVFRWNPDAQNLVLEESAGPRKTVYRGHLPDDWPSTLEMTSAADETGQVRRCTVRQLSDIRLTILFEQQASTSGAFRRVVEIGYTRAGQRLAVDGANQRKCIVTGGLGTIPVTWNSKTYYVCCQGCVQAFNDAPAAIIAEYEASLKAK